MNEYSAKLNLAVSSHGLDDADKGLKTIQKEGSKAERATDGVGKAFKRVIAPIAAFVSVSAGLKKIVDVTKQFQGFEAVLETATGSAEGANIAFEALTEFAKTTPYQLEQSVEAFKTLVNLGLNPSERALRSYGDTASAMGKDLTQFIEAVADASTNEFERLKEFGIKASQQGDNVAFTFRGVTTTVRKNAEEIQEYLIGLGETNFDGAMKRRMDTLEGSISNFGDTWDQLFNSVSEKGLGALIKDAVDTGTQAIVELDALLKSGQLEKGAEAFFGKFDGYGEDISATFDIIRELYQEHLGDLNEDSDKAVKVISSAFGNMPENIRAFIKIMTTEIASFIDKSGAYGEEILENLQFWKDETFDLDKRLKEIDSARKSSIEAILNDREKATGAAKIEFDNVRKLRDEYDRLQDEREKATLDNVPLKNKQDETIKPKVGESTTSPSQKAFNKLIDNVIPPSDQINKVFESRFALIEENTEKGSEKQKELLERLNKDYATEILQGFEVQPDDFDFEGQAQLINDQFEARRKLILDNTQLTEEQRTTLEEALTKGRTDKLQKIEEASFKARLGVAKSMLGNLSSLMNSESRSAFEIGKVAAISNAVISGIEAAVHSYKFGAKLGGPALGAAFAATSVAATGVQIQQLKSQQFGGGGSTSSPSSVGDSVYRPPQPEVPSGPVDPEEGSRPINLYLHRDFQGNVSLVDQIDDLRDYIEETDYVLISGSSRNGQELAA